MKGNLPTANLKNTKHLNLVFRTPGWDRELVGGVLDWLAGKSMDQPSQAAKEAHLDELERRQDGKSLVSVSAATGVSLRDLGAMPVLLRHFSYVQVRTPEATLSLDVFNAGNELNIGAEPEGLVLELFGVSGRIASSLVGLALEVVDEWPVDFVFGGRAVFTADFALARARAREDGRELRVRDFLWPFTFSHTLSRVSDNDLRGLPAFRTGREVDGAWIWLFEDLSMGHSDDYFATANALGLRSLWEQELVG